MNKPRLRKRGRGANKEVAVPACKAMLQDTGTGEGDAPDCIKWRFDAPLSKVISEMADTVGVSPSTVSRKAAEIFEAALKQLLERRFVTPTC